VKNFTQTPNSILFHPNLSNQEKLLWIMLKAFCHGKEKCWPSIKTLSEAMGVSRRTVERGLVVLVKEKCLTKESHPGRTTTYIPTSPMTQVSNVRALPQAAKKKAAPTPTPVTHDKPSTYTHVTHDAPPPSPMTYTHVTHDAQKNIKEEYKEKNISFSKKKKNAKPETDPRIKEIIDWFFDEYQRIKGSKYVVQGKKDAASVKRLLGTLDLHDIKDRITLFLEDNDPWLVEKTGHTIAIFASRVNKYTPVHQQPTTPAHIKWEA
jgi:hypothetical protein